MKDKDRIRPADRHTYTIRIAGALDPRWSAWLADANLTREPGAEGSVTLLYSAPIDQAALHGLLAKIRDLNLELLSVTRNETLGIQNDTPKTRRKKHE